jgi:hypothetical protein
MDNQYESMQPPREAYLYFPAADECKYTMGKLTIRRIFDG